MRLLAGLVLAAVSIVATPSRDASACSCALEAPRISPADGAVDVPINARVFMSFGFQQTVAVELREVGTGTVVPLTVESHERFTGMWLSAAPTVALAPNTTYEVVVDSQVPTRSTFLTGDGTDLTPPAFDGLVSLAPETMRYPIENAEGGFCFDSCVEGTGHISRLRLGFAEPPAEAALVTFTLLRDGAVVDELAMPSNFNEPAGHVLGFSTCERRSPVLEPGASYCGRLTAYDAAGNTAGGTVEVCAVAEACVPVLADNGCTPSDRCDLGAEGGCAGTRSGQTGAGLVLVVLAIAFRRRGRSLVRCQAREPYASCRGGGSSGRSRTES